MVLRSSPHSQRFILLWDQVLELGPRILNRVLRLKLVDETRLILRALIGNALFRKVIVSLGHRGNKTATPVSMEDFFGLLKADLGLPRVDIMIFQFYRLSNLLHSGFISSHISSHYGMILQERVVDFRTLLDGTLLRPLSIA